MTERAGERPAAGSQDRASSSGRRVVLQVTFAIALSGAVVWVLLSQLEWSRARGIVSQASPRWLIAALAWSALIVFARGWRWRLIHPAPGFATSTAAIAVQTFYNRIAPLRLGELSLPILLRRYAGADAAQTLVLLILVRITELAVAVGLIVLAGLAGRGAGEAGYLVMLVGLLVVVTAVLLQFRRALRVAVRLASWVARWSRLERVSGVKRGLTRLDEAIGSEARLGRRTSAGLLLATLLVQALQILAFDAILRAFGVELGPTAVVLGAAVALAGPALPLPSVGTIGTLEASWVVGFVWVGVELDRAILTGMATQILTLAFAAFIALPSWVYLVRRRRRNR